jgi:XrtJ-associated TM-motif-TM protein
MGEVSSSLPYWAEKNRQRKILKYIHVGYVYPGENRLMKIKFAVLAALFLACGSASLFAQTGCFDSPEAPTDVLLVVGSAGMFYGSSFVMKALRKRR